MRSVEVEWAEHKSTLFYDGGGGGGRGMSSVMNLFSAASLIRKLSELFGIYGMRNNEEASKSFTSRLLERTTNRCLVVGS